MEQHKHTEYRAEKENCDRVIVFIHGILESPDQFHDLIARLDKEESSVGNYSVINLLLPGHGGRGKEFAHASMKQWQGYVDDTIRALQARYRTIILVGHSMGCLLAIQAALEFKSHVRGLFLLAVPLCIKMSYSGMKNGLKVACNRVKAGDERAMAAKNAYSIQQDSLIGYFAWLPRYVELFMKSRRTCKLFKEIKIPTIVIQAEGDEFVSRRTLRYLSENAKVRLLKRSGHFFYTPEEHELIIGDFIAFLRGMHR